MGIKDFEIPLTIDDKIDVRIVTEKMKVTGFVLNLRCRFDSAWYQVYRVDTAHNYLHEQRFWISPEPIRLPTYEGIPLKATFDYFMEQIKNNYERYRSYYAEKMKPGG